MNTQYFRYAFIPLVAFCLLGCIESRKDITDQDLPRYKFLQGRSLGASSDLFVILDKSTDQRYLYYPGDQQVTPFEVSHYQGKDLPCPGLGKRAFVVGTFPSGTVFKVTRIIEGRHMEAGSFNEVFVQQEGGASNILYHIEYLLEDSGESHIFGNRFLKPKDNYLQFRAAGSHRH